MHGKTVQCDDSAEIGSVHDKEQGSENRPLRNAIQDQPYIRALWRPGLSVILPGCQNYKWLNPVWHRMLCSCTLIWGRLRRTQFCPLCQEEEETALRAPWEVQSSRLYHSL